MLAIQVQSDPNRKPPMFFSTQNEDKYRIIRYDFDQSFLQSSSFSTLLSFRLGQSDVYSIRLIEKYYFRKDLVMSFDFDFGECKANSDNTWECMYTIPKIDSTVRKSMIENPYETTSDSYIFVDNRLVVHNKATYSFRKPLIPK